MVTTYVRASGEIDDYELVNSPFRAPLVSHRFTFTSRLLQLNRIYRAVLSIFFNNIFLFNSYLNTNNIKMQKKCEKTY